MIEGIPGTPFEDEVLIRRLRWTSDETGFAIVDAEDEYEDALKELIEKKAKGERIEAPTPTRSNVVNLMDALRASIKAEGKNEGRKAKTSAQRPTKKAARSPGRQKKAS